jgi:hypothetical protein
VGGLGSGRRWNSKQTTFDYHQLDVRRWQRDGLLVAGRSFFWPRWKVEVASALNTLAKPVRVTLSPQQQGERYPVWLSWTRCNYGGARAWFLCPAQGCGRRVAILYAGGLLACRHCCGLAYPVEQESKWHRTLRRARGIRVRLRGSLSLVDPFPERPKGMHRQTYHRLYAEGQQREGAFIAACSQFLEYAGSRLHRRL